MMQSCVFDLDGTLLNSLPTILHYNNLSLVHFGLHPITARECQNLCRYSIAEFYHRLLRLGGCPEEKVEELAPQIRDYDLEVYLQDFTYLSEPYPQIKELLQELRRRGVLLAVLTNKPHAIAQAVIEQFFPGVFHIVCGQTPDTISKPDPRSLWDLLDRLGADREKCVYVGDTDIDLKTALSANVTAAAAAWGFQSREILESFHPALMAENPLDILSLY